MVDVVLVIACETGSSESIAPNCTRAIFYAGNTYKTQIWICDVILTEFSPVKRDLYVEEEDCSTRTANVIIQIYQLLCSSHYFAFYVGVLCEIHVMKMNTYCGDNADGVDLKGGI